MRNHHDLVDHHAAGAKIVLTSKTLLECCRILPHVVHGQAEYQAFDMRDACKMDGAKEQRGVSVGHHIVIGESAARLAVRSTQGHVRPKFIVVPVNRDGDHVTR